MNLSNEKLGVLLFAHGARAESWRAPFDALRNMVQAQLSSIPVEQGFLEFMQPDFAASVQRLADMGCSHIRVELMFLAKGVHTLRDLTELINQATLQHPTLSFSISEAMLENATLLRGSQEWIVQDILQLQTDRFAADHNAATVNLQNRIAAGALVEWNNKLLMVHHVKLGVYDFWAPPGGGVQGVESLIQAAQREVFEEVSLQVDIGALAYIEEFYQPGMRHVKSWFIGQLAESNLTDEAIEHKLRESSPAARLEGIVETRFLSEQEINQLPHFPEFVKKYWNDRHNGFKSPSYQGIRAMKFW